MKKVLVRVLFLVGFIFNPQLLFSQCAGAVNGNYYFVSNGGDSGPGTLRQALLDANFDNVGGVVVELAELINKNFHTFVE